MSKIINIFLILIWVLFCFSSCKEEAREGVYKCIDCEAAEQLILEKEKYEWKKEDVYYEVIEVAIGTWYEFKGHSIMLKRQILNHREWEPLYGENKEIDLMLAAKENKVFSFRYNAQLKIANDTLIDLETKKVYLKIK